MASPSAAAPRPASAFAIALALAAVYVIWGSTYLGIRFALEGGWPPLLAVSGGRMLIAGALMYAVLRLRGEPGPTRRQWPALAVMGVLMMLLGNGMVVLAEEQVSSGLAAIAIASMPLWMGLFGAMLGRHPSRGEWLGIGIGFLGVLCVVRPDAGILDPHALAVVGSVLFSACRDLLMRGRTMPSPFCLALFSAAGTTLFGLAGLAATGAPAAVPTSALGLLALAASAISLGYVFLALATATGGSGFVSPFRYSILVFATIFGVVALGERPDRIALLGIGLIILGGLTATLSSFHRRN